MTTTLINISKIIRDQWSVNNGQRFEVHYTTDGSTWLTAKTRSNAQLFMTGRERGAYVMTQADDSGWVTDLRLATIDDVKE